MTTTETTTGPDMWQVEPLPEERPCVVPDRQATLRTAWFVPASGILVFAVLILWSQLLGPLFPQAVERIGDGVTITLAAIFALVLAARSGQTNVQLERAYSEHLEKLSESLRQIAYHDSLTGLYNHRYFREQLPHELQRAFRYGHSLSVVMLDVNHFKEVNDRYGHLMGDKLLAFLGRLIAENVRSTDIPARYGGDEFALLLPETEASAARATADKLTEVIAKRRDWGGGLLQAVTLGVAVGVATFPQDGTTEEALLLCADRGLYASKPPLEASKLMQAAAARRRRSS